MFFLKIGAIYRDEIKSKDINNVIYTERDKSFHSNSALSSLLTYDKENHIILIYFRYSKNVV